MNFPDPNEPPPDDWRDPMPWHLPDPDPGLPLAPGEPRPGYLPAGPPPEWLPTKPPGVRLMSWRMLCRFARYPSRLDAIIARLGTPPDEFVD